MVDECVFYIDDVMILPTLMTESSWVCQTNNLRVSHLNSMTLVLTIDQEDQGYSVNSVGIDIHKHENVSYKFTEQTLINNITQDVGGQGKYTKPVSS